MVGRSVLRIVALAGAVASGFFMATGAASASMSFRFTQAGDPQTCGAKCPQIIVAEGEIVDRTPRDFIDFLRSQKLGNNVYAVVLMNSPGGRVVASMELGRLLRRAGAAVVIAKPVEQSGAEMRFASGRCYSACVYALMGAKKRVVPPQSRVGIHRMFLYERVGQLDGTTKMTKTFAQDEMVNKLGEYAGMMGVSRELVYTAEKTPSETFRLLTPQEIRRWHLASEKF